MNEEQLKEFEKENDIYFSRVMPSEDNKIFMSHHVYFVQLSIDGQLITEGKNIWTFSLLDFLKLLNFWNSGNCKCWTIL